MHDQATTLSSLADSHRADGAVPSHQRSDRHRDDHHGHDDACGLTDPMMGHQNDVADDHSRAAGRRNANQDHRGNHDCEDHRDDHQPQPTRHDRTECEEFDLNIKINRQDQNE